MDSVNCAPRKRSRPSHFDAPPIFAAAQSVFITPEPGMSHPKNCRVETAAPLTIIHAAILVPGEKSSQGIHDKVLPDPPNRLIVPEH